MFEREHDLKLVRVLTFAPVLVAMTSGAIARAQASVEVEIDGKASYEQSLACYQYYVVALQVAEVGAAKADAGSDVQKALQRRTVVNKVLNMVWNKNIDATSGGKSNQVVDEDLEKIGAPIIADANAGLKGDKAAEARYEAIQTKCKTFEKVARTRD